MMQNQPRKRMTKTEILEIATVFTAIDAVIVVLRAFDFGVPDWALVGCTAIVVICLAVADFSK